MNKVVLLCILICIVSVNPSFSGEFQYECVVEKTFNYSKEKRDYLNYDTHGGETFYVEKRTGQIKGKYFEYIPPGSGNVTFINPKGNLGKYAFLNSFNDLFVYFEVNDDSSNSSKPFQLLLVGSQMHMGLCK